MSRTYKYNHERPFYASKSPVGHHNDSCDSYLTPRHYLQQKSTNRRALMCVIVAQHHFFFSTLHSCSVFIRAINIIISTIISIIVLYPKRVEFAGLLLLLVYYVGDDLRRAGGRSCQAVIILLQVSFLGPLVPAQPGIISDVAASYMHPLVTVSVLIMDNEFYMSNHRSSIEDVLRVACIRIV